MYIGIGPEKGNRIPDREAFGYACGRCLFGDQDETETFIKIMKDSGDIEDFAKCLVEWFFSGNWVYDEFDNREASWIIRFSNSEIYGCFFGTYAEAVAKGREEAKKRGLGFVVA